MADKIKVVWICSVSNPQLRAHLNLYVPLWERIIRFITGHKIDKGVADSAVWNTNALNEFEKIDAVDLHVIFVHPRMRKNIQAFIEKSIHFYAVSENDDSFMSFLRKRFVKGSLPYEKTWKRIVMEVKKIKPDIIHMMGAENPQYSWSLMRLPKNIPTFVQLQTLTHNPAVLKAYPNIHPEYELPVLQRTNYIGTCSDIFPQMIRTYITANPIILRTQLLVAEEPDLSSNEKEFDFVYFSNYVSKAIDLAVGAFAEAIKEHPGITLDIIGGITDEERLTLKTLFNRLGIQDFVSIEGRLPTHEDVIKQIKKARFALLPLKSDLVSGTIREAMSVGIPVVSNITQGTPSLNEKRESVLLSPIGDNKAMARNMIRLLCDDTLADSLRTNAVITVREKYGSNVERAKEWIVAYRACIDNFKNNIPIPNTILNNN